MNLKNKNNLNAEEPIQTSRRGFLKALTAGGAAAGLLTMTSTQALANSTTVSVAEAPEKQDGYHETDHIRSYYDSLR